MVDRAMTQQMYACGRQTEDTHRHGNDMLTRNDMHRHTDTLTHGMDEEKNTHQVLRKLNVDALDRQGVA